MYVTLQYGKSDRELRRIDLHNSDREKEKKISKYVENIILITGLNTKVSRSSLENLFKQVDGFKRLILSEPNNRAAFIRNGYVIYNSVESCQTAIERFNFMKVDNFELRLRANQRTISYKHAPITALNQQRIQTDLTQAISLIKLFDRERNIECNVFDSTEFESLSNPVKQLNIALLYLRQVHHYCYYCHTAYDDYDTLFNTCGLTHPRDAQDINEIEETNYFKAIDDTYNNIMEHGIPVSEKQQLFDKYVDMNKLDTALQTFYDEAIIRKGEGKYKCNICSKLFKDTVFVKKHIGNKHNDELVNVEGKMSEEMMFQLYANDPNRPIDASANTATSMDTSRSEHPRSPLRTATTISTGSSGKTDIFGRALREEDEAEERERSLSPPTQPARGMPLLNNPNLPVKFPYGANGMPMVMPAGFNAPRAAPFQQRSMVPGFQARDPSLVSHYFTANFVFYLLVFVLITHTHLCHVCLCIVNATSWCEYAWYYGTATIIWSAK